MAMLHCGGRMHSYSIDSDIRKKVYFGIFVIAMAIPAVFEKIRMLTGLPDYLAVPLSFSTIFGALYFIFNCFLWKYFSWLTSIPNLAGEWVASGKSSYTDPVTNENVTFVMAITIRQNFSEMEIFTETAESTSRSTMAGFFSRHAIPLFRYSFENTPKNMANQELQRHPGLIELRIQSDGTLVGDYFSGKHRLRYGELEVKRK